jgi:hypothetical protein
LGSRSNCAPSAFAKEKNRCSTLLLDLLTVLLEISGASALPLIRCPRGLWNEQAQYDADPEATETNFARLVDYFGKCITDMAKPPN